MTNSPNENISSFDLINKLEVSRNETGNGYAVIGRDIRMRVESITPLDVAYVTPFINADDQNLWYEVRGAEHTYYIHNMNMIHVKHITGTSRLAGISPLNVLKNTLEYDKAVQKFSLSEMQKKDSFVLKYGANIDPEKRQRIIDDFRRFYKESGGLLFQERGVEVDNLERKYFASDTLASERITRSRVANVFNVPVSFLNDTEGQSYSSNEQMMIQFVQMALTPIVRQYEQEFNRKLLTQLERKQGHYFKFSLGEPDTSALGAGDGVTLYELAKLEVTPNPPVSTLLSTYPVGYTTQSPYSRNMYNQNSSLYGGMVVLDTGNGNQTVNYLLIG